ncbi:MAG TPA: 30S ribosomal protein S20 [Bryobacteraceae bacterium]|jgi:small subunit ribosomal protein S20|nr:30S ribosomal protein S20 [Bryobacteraceae bacterium]
MANTHGALKRVRQTERRTEFNRFAKTRLRHQIRAMRRALTAKAPVAADVKSAMDATFSLVDKAARKGYIKRGTAARYKSRMHTRAKVVLGDVQK